MSLLEKYVIWLSELNAGFGRGSTAVLAEEFLTGKPSQTLKGFPSIVKESVLSGEAKNLNSAYYDLSIKIFSN